MAGAIRLEGPPRSTIPEDVAGIQKTLDLLAEREQVRQDRQRISDFITENIRLTGENPDMDPDQIAQQAAANVTAKEPQFSGGIAGGFQRFASRLGPGGPSTALTGPIAGELLNQPTGLRADVIKEQILASQASRQQKADAPEKPTAGQRQRDSDITIVNSSKSTPGQKTEARERLKSSPDLFEVNESDEELAKEFQKVLKGKKKIKSGRTLDKVFGKEAFDAALEEAIENGLKEGASPESVTQAFENFWDEQFQKEKGQKFQKFQDRKEFASSIEEALQKALKAGTIDAGDVEKARKLIKDNPANEAKVLELL